MTDPLQLLYDIPILGLVFQFIAYLITTIPVVAPIILRSAAPIGFAAMCGVVCERSGVVNIGIEGIMLTGAFVGWLVGAILAPTLGAFAVPIFGITAALLLGVLAAILAGMLVSLLHAWLSISVRADQIISGTIINIAAAGMTTYLYVLLQQSSLGGAGAFRPYVPPAALTDLPFVGWIFRTLLNQGPLTISLIVITIFIQVVLFRSRWGLRTRAVGEHPKAAETVGIDVIRLRYRNVILGGIFAGLGGAYLTIEFGSAFQGEMTAGRGFIALAALIFGRWTPIGALGAAILFTASIGLERSIRFAAPEGPLGQFLTSIPLQFYSALPYLITIIVLAGVVGRSIAPAAVGRPYERESKAA
jgi:general nucleoside transport system permease protein